MIPASWGESKPFSACATLACTEELSIISCAVLITPRLAQHLFHPRECSTIWGQAPCTLDVQQALAISAKATAQSICMLPANQRLDNR